MRDLKYFGKVDDGKLTIFSRGEMLKDINKVGEASIELIIRFAGKRSGQQNKYYWSAIIPIVRDGLKKVGIEMSKEQTHELLKYKFLMREFITSDGDILKSIGSSKELNKQEFSEYKESIQQWASEYLGIIVPDPNEQIELYNTPKREEIEQL